MWVLGDGIASNYYFPQRLKKIVVYFFVLVKGLKCFQDLAFLHEIGRLFRPSMCFEDVGLLPSQLHFASNISMRQS